MAHWTPLSWLAAAFKTLLTALAWLVQQPLRAFSGSVTWGAAAA
jgi:uncharacterized PurR-regulated membrane protein YhhQ (DUF165 family)